MVALSIAFIILALLTLDWVVAHTRARSTPAVDELPLFERPMWPVAEPPASRWLSPGHVWAKLDDDGLVTLGTDGFAGWLLGAPERVEALPATEPVATGEPLARLVARDRELTLRSPIRGEVVRTNPRLGTEPALAARDPWGDGWLCRIAPEAAADDLGHCHLAERASAWSRSELALLRDRLGTLAQEGTVPTLADGGLPIAGLAHLLPEEAWHRLERQLFEPPTDERRDAR